MERFITILILLFCFWNTNIKDVSKIFFQYSENKMFYDNHKGLSHEQVGDQKVIIESKINYKCNI